MLGWGGGDVNVPCTCTHVGCYARCWVGVGGMLTFLALAHKSSTVCFSLHELLQRTAAKSLLERKWSTKSGSILMISCPSPSIISPKQPDWSEWKKDAADSLLKFQRALNADATLFLVGACLEMVFWKDRWSQRCWSTSWKWQTSLNQFNTITFRKSH